MERKPSGQFWELVENQPQRHRPPHVLREVEVLKSTRVSHQLMARVPPEPSILPHFQGASRGQSGSARQRTPSGKEAQRPVGDTWPASTTGVRREGGRVKENGLLRPNPVSSPFLPQNSLIFTQRPLSCSIDKSLCLKRGF